MVFQIPQTIEKKLSVKLKIAMVTGSVVVLVGATFAGYYFGQKKNNGQSQVVQNNDNVVSPTDTVGETVPDPIIAPDGANNPAVVNFPTTSLPQEIEKKIVWFSPKKITNLQWFKNDVSTSSDSEYLKSTYFEVGRFTDNGDAGKVILVEIPPEGPGFGWFFHIVEFKNQLIVLTRYADFDSYSDKSGLSYYINTFTDEVQSRVRLDNDFAISQLEFPKKLTGPKEKQTLELKGVYQMQEAWFGRSDAEKIKSKGVVVFSDPSFGNVYSLENGGFYIVGAHQAFAAYAVKPDFFKENSNIASIIWNDGLVNIYDYTYGDPGGCGSTNYISVVTSTDITVKNDLEVIGKTDKGDNIYGLKDKNHRLLKYMYENTYQGDYSGNNNGVKISYEEFLTQKPIIFWVDPFGRLIKMENGRFMVQAECGKPVIYLYPEKTSVVDVKVEPQGGMTVSDPLYNDGWQVKAEPNGQLTETKSGKQYPYLFWEGRGGLYQTPERGFVMKKEEIATELPKKLAQLGLNVNETKDFMEFWYPRMQAKPYYFVTFLGTPQMNQLAPLTINPSPDTVVRILMDFTPLDKPIDVLPLSLGRTPERKGFTVIEWGGVIRK